MLIGEICTRKVIIVKRQDSICDAASLMRTYHVGDVVVVEQKNEQIKPVGILTDRDIVIELVAKNIPLDSVSVEDVMSTELFVTQESCELWEAIKLMQVKGIKRIIVVNDKGELVGIISTDDLFELLSAELLDLAKVVIKGQHREEEIRE